MKTVLVVDSRSKVRQLIREFLEEEVSVMEASDSREALSLLDERSVDMLLIDTPMPGGGSSGLFMLGSKDSPQDHDISCFLAKPFSRSELRDFVFRKIK